MNLKNKMSDMKFVGKITNFVKENGSTLSMVGGLICLGISLYEAFKASDEVSEIGKEYAKKIEEIERSTATGDEKAKQLKQAKSMRNLQYVSAEKWTLVFGGASAGLIFLTKYLDGIAISGLAALAMSKQEELKNFTEKAKEIIGEDKVEEIKEECLEDKILRNFVKEDGNVALKPYHRGGKIFVDTNTGAIFQMDEEDLKAVLERAEDYCARNHYLYQDKFFSMMGVDPPDEKQAKVRRWGPDNPFKAKIGTRTAFGMTCSSIEYDYQPQPVNKH